MEILYIFRFDIATFSGEWGRVGIQFSKKARSFLEKRMVLCNFERTRDGFPIEIQSQISKLITYSSAIFIIIKIA